VIEAGGHAACIVVLPAPSPLKWASLQQLSKASNLTAAYHTCDITSEINVSATLDAIARVGAENGAPLYGTIACAGIQQKLPAIGYLAEGLRRILDINVRGTFLTIKHSARIL
jgi:NAD(P)-dependent dehydrogenase (short-subunit alcohol dehydrogenase family)